MGHTWSQWSDELRARTGDLGVLQAVEDSLIPAAIGAALAKLGRDVPLWHSQTLTGTGLVYDFDLAAAPGVFVVGWSQLELVEYPAGEKLRRIVDTFGYEVLPGTGTLRLLDAVPAATETVKVAYTRLYPTPTDTASADLVPDGLFEPVVALAASKLLRAEGSKMGRRQSVSVLSNLSQLDPSQLFAAADLLAAEYRDTVMPGSAGVGGGGGSVGYAISDMDPSEGYLWHGGRR